MVCPGVPSALAPAAPMEANGTTPHLGVGSTVSNTPEGFMDTPVVNGVAYPTLTGDPKPYRFRILSLANERSFNQARNQDRLKESSLAPLRMRKGDGFGSMVKVG